MLNLSLKHEYFDAIQSGLKTVEGRINSSKFKDLKIEDLISFASTRTNETIICIVIDIKTYSNFEDMIQQEGINKILPGIPSISEGVSIYESFPGYSDNVKKIGAIAIRIQKQTLTQ